MKRLTVLALVLGFAGCARQPMTKHQFARGAVSVGAAVLITTAIVIAEMNDATTPGQPERSLR